MREFWQNLAFFCLQLAKLAELVAARIEDGSAHEAYFEERHVIDVLEDFSFARPSVDELLQVLRPLQPRLYSISSSPLEAPARVQASPPSALGE